MQFFVLWGFVLWVIATGLFRWVGHYVVDPENPSSVVYMFVAAVPLVAFTTYPLYAWRRVAGRDRQAAAALIALPGMLLDVLAVLSFAALFPNLGDSGRYVAGWLLWVYGLVLLTGFVPPAPRGE